MMLCASLPLYFSAAEKHSRAIFLLGTGAMFGICFFDLVPDVFEMGGRHSLLVMALVWVLYSLAHLFHLGHHHHRHGGAEGDASSGFYLFLGSIIAHCFASGMLLTASYGLSSQVAGTVFFALLAHKSYESLLLASVVLSQRRSRSWRAGVIAVYALSLPAGAVVTAFFREAINQRIAILISSVAVGTLLGCLIFDFILPSIRQLRHHRHRIGWIVAGMVLTQLVMKQI